MTAVTILLDDRCPTCGKLLDACSPVPGRERAAPEPGDITICFGCGELLWFDAQMRHRVLPPKRVAEFDEEFREFIRIGQEAVRERRAQRIAEGRSA